MMWHGAKGVSCMTYSSCILREFLGNNFVSVVKRENLRKTKRKHFQKPKNLKTVSKIPRFFQP